MEQTTQHIEVEDEGIAHDYIHIIGENIGWGPLLIIILLGAKKAWREKIIGMAASMFGLKLVKKGKK